MKKILLGLFLIANSIGSYAKDSSQIEPSENEQKMLCNKQVTSQQKLNFQDNEKLILISMEYYREYENKSKQLIKDSVTNSTLVNKNDGEPSPFSFNANARYLVSMKHNGQEMNDGVHYIDQDGKVKALKYPFENKSFYGNIYTNIDEKDNKVNMKLCLNKSAETQDNINNEYIYKEITVQFNEPTIINLSDGYKLKIKLHKYEI